MKQYSKRIALFHWIIFALVCIAFYFGHELDESKNAAEKLSMYPVHFLIGSLALLLTVFRLYFRKTDGEPAPANSNPLLNKVANATHKLLNLSLLAVVISGITTAVTSGVIEALKTGNAELIPDFHKVEAKEFHEMFIAVMLLLIAFHVAAALYHQFVVKDNLLRRIMVRRFKD